MKPTEIIGKISTMADVFYKLNNIDYYKQMLELQGEVLKLSEENLALKTDLFEIRSKETLRENLKFEHGVYWNKSNDSGPYCSNCFDTKGQTVNLLREHESSNVCPNCKTKYKPRWRNQNSV